MRDTLYNTATVAAIAIFIAFILYVAMSTGRLGHPANNCLEDETWAPVHYQTLDADEDANGVTRMCVNLDEL